MRAPTADHTWNASPAQGFASSWLSKRVLNVFDGSSCVAPAAELLRRLPCTPCLHIWLVRAPRSRCAGCRMTQQRRLQPARMHAADARSRMAAARRSCL